MRYVKLKITRDINAVYNIAVVPWEQPVLEVVFDPGNVQATGEMRVVKKTPEDAYPNEGREFDRLTRKFGADPESGTPYVAIAYGNARAGLQALQAAIAAARVADEEVDKAEKVEKVEKVGGARRGRPPRVASVLEADLTA